MTISQIRVQPSRQVPRSALDVNAAAVDETAASQLVKLYLQANRGTPANCTAISHVL